jgi:glycosyltransferase involved in cell wall biosynthesis
LQTSAAAFEEVDAGLAATPYFVALGTIEPRKNLLALINLWRAMIEAGERPPKLVIVGGRGWLNDETAAALDRSRALKGCVAEVAGLGDVALRTLLRQSRGLLATSFAEGYGLPVVEALELGVPVIAADLPIFREVTRGCATLIATIDGTAWRRAVTGLADAHAPEAREARRRAQGFSGVDAAVYFERLQAFLQGL